MIMITPKQALEIAKNYLKEKKRSFTSIKWGMGARAVGVRIDVNNVLYGIFENNEVWYDQDKENRRYIFFAESGQYTFVFNKTEMNFELLDRYSGDVVEVFDSFNKMLERILKLMLT